MWLLRERAIVLIQACQTAGRGPEIALENSGVILLEDKPDFLRTVYKLHFSACELKGQSQRDNLPIR